jgi:PAS domain-containing protein
MKTIKKQVEKTAIPSRADFFERLWEKSWTYIRTVVDVVREPVLVLDKDFRVIAANDPFYRAFQVEPTETENKIIYELGNGQWDIPDLRSLLEDILPQNSFFKGFEVTHEFPNIGRKVMILNARQIYFEEDTFLKGYGPLELDQHIILLAIEDVTEMMAVAEALANHTKEFEDELTKRTQKMEVRIEKLRDEIEKLKKNPPGQRNQKSESISSKN